MNGNSLLIIAFLALQSLLAACVFWAMPTWSRPELFFAITVPKDFRVSESGRAILASYRGKILWIFGLSLAGLVTSNWLPNAALRWTGMIGCSTMLAIIGYIVIYVRTRSAAAPYAVAPSHVREAVLASSVRRALSKKQRLAFAVPLLLIAAAAIAVVGYYPSLPDSIPTHFNLAGEPDAWTDKSYGPLMFPLGIAAVLSLGLFLLTGWILRSLPVRTADEDALVLEEQRRTAIVELLVVISWLLTAVFILVTGAMVTPRGVSHRLTIAALLLSLFMASGLIVWFLIRHGKAFTATTRRAEASPAGAPYGDRTDDRHWKLGAIYYNPDDPAVWVEKRLGIGYTNNMARSESWVMLIGLFVVTGLIVVGALLVGH